MAPELIALLITDVWKLVALTEVVEDQAPDEKAAIARVVEALTEQHPTMDVRIKKCLAPGCGHLMPDNPAVQVPCPWAYCTECRAKQRSDQALVEA